MTETETLKAALQDEAADQPLEELPEGAIAWFAGAAIYPLSSSHQKTIQKIGAGMFSASNYIESEGNLALKMNYPGMMEDVGNVLYVCRFPGSRQSTLRSNVGIVKKQADKWSDEINLSVGSTVWEGALELFSTLIEGGLGEGKAP